MTEYFILKYLHIIAFVYWLGGDLGTFIASGQMVNPNNSKEARHVAMKIMMACDQGPRLGMPIILALGVQIAQSMGLMNLPVWGVVLMWLATLWWVGNVAILHFKEGKPITKTLTAIDFYFRILVIVVVVSVAAYGLTGNGLITANWVSYKLLIFAAMVGCGLMVRVGLKPFIPAFIQMMQTGATPQTDAAIAGSIAKVRPWVWTIWVGLFVNAALGVHLI